MTTPSITVVLTNYLRPHNVERILEALSGQSLSHRLFVFDNSPSGTYRWKADWLLRSTPSLPPAARWWMASQAETEFVVCLDDDLTFADEDVLATTVDALREWESSAIGATGVRLVPGQSYCHGQHYGLATRPITEDTQVDIIKGRYFATPTVHLRGLPFLPLECEDDIIVSAAMETKVVSQDLQGRFVELPTGNESRWKRGEHWAANYGNRLPIDSLASE